jgi:hypothetical protein
VKIANVKKGGTALAGGQTNTSLLPNGQRGGLAEDEKRTFCDDGHFGTARRPLCTQVKVTLSRRPSHDGWSLATDLGLTYWEWLVFVAERTLSATSSSAFVAMVPIGGRIRIAVKSYHEVQPPAGMQRSTCMSLSANECPKMIMAFFAFPQQASKLRSALCR